MSTPQLPPLSPIFQPQITDASDADESGLISAGANSTTAKFNARDVSQSDISTSLESKIDAAGSVTDSPGNECRGVREPSLSPAVNPTFAREKPPLASSGDAPITASSAPLQSDSDLTEDPTVKFAVKWRMALYMASPPEVQKRILNHFQKQSSLPEMSRSELETAQPGIIVPINLQEQSVDVKTNSESIQQHQLPGTKEMIVVNQLHSDIDVIEQQLLEKLSEKDQKIENAAEIRPAFDQVCHLNRVIDTIPTASEKARLKQRVDGLKDSIREWFFAIPAFCAIKKMKSELENFQFQKTPVDIHSFSTDLAEFDELFKMFPSGVAMNNIKRELDSLKSSISDIQKNV